MNYLNVAQTFSSVEDITGRYKQDSEYKERVKTRNNCKDFQRDINYMMLVSYLDHSKMPQASHNIYQDFKRDDRKDIIFTVIFDHHISFP